MAPLPQTSPLSTLLTLFSRQPTPQPSPTTPLEPLKQLLTRTSSILLPRSSLTNPGSGVTDPSSIPNKVVFILFGLIGAGLVCTSIWFFFWAKNGGFYFKQNDWDDYKTTVLRRRGPNGTTLSGATESTDLGGGSVVHGESQSEKGGGWGRKKGRKERKERERKERYKDFDEDGNTVYTGGMESSLGGSTLGTSELGSEHPLNTKERKEKKERRWRRRAKKSEVGEGSVLGSEIPDEDGEMDVGVAETVRAYRHEKPARVGGINKESEGSAWDGSTNDNSTTASSELLSNNGRSERDIPTHTPTRVRRKRDEGYTPSSKEGIRKVVSTSKPPQSHQQATVTPSDISYTTNTLSSISETGRLLEENPLKVEARRLQEKGRSAAAAASSGAKRDFSFRVGDDNSSRVSESSYGDITGETREERRERRRKSRSPTKKLVVPGSFREESEVSGASESLLSGGSEMDGDVGTKSYHHPIPGLSSLGGGSSVAGGGANDYAEEKRRKRAGGGGGYRRGRGDDDE